MSWFVHPIPDPKIKKEYIMVLGRGKSRKAAAPPPKKAKKAPVPVFSEGGEDDNTTAANGDSAEATTTTATKTRARKATKKPAAKKQSGGSKRPPAKATQKPGSKKKTPAKKKVVKKNSQPKAQSNGTDGRSLPRQMNEHGFVIGSNSAKIVDEMLKGGESRSDVATRVNKQIKGRDGTEVNGNALISGLLHRLKKQGYTVESSWRLVEPTPQSKARATREAKKRAKASEQG